MCDSFTRIMVTTCKAIWRLREQGITQVSATRLAIWKYSMHMSFCSCGGGYAQILREGHLYDMVVLQNFSPSWSCQRGVALGKALEERFPSRVPPLPNRTKTCTRHENIRKCSHFFTKCLWHCTYQCMHNPIQLFLRRSKTHLHVPKFVLSC